MKYFAKYLPVEGEIKIGDRHISEIQEEIEHYIFTSAHSYSEQKAKDIGLTKVKLFLCSRDIQIDDKITWLPEGISEYDCPGIICDEIDIAIVKEKSKWAYKVIGEISPDTLGYVKEGDEFDENQIKLPSTTKRLSSIPWCILIKGPCGHFH